MNHFITNAQLGREGVLGLIDDAIRMKSGDLAPDLSGKNLILLFFNPSLRTRTSFELAMMQLGGNVVTLNAGGDTWTLETEDGVVMDGDRVEHIREAAGVLGRYGDAIAVRAFPKGKSWEEDRKDPIIGRFVKDAGVPVINMESSLYHPNQSLGDLMTVVERFGRDLKGVPITITWANHPNPLPMAVPNSILLTSALFGMDIRFLRPDGYDLDDEIMKTATSLCEKAGGRLKVTDSFEEGYRDSRVVYAKSWGSLRYYGDREGERAHRRGLRGWIVDDGKMSMTKDACFMHCLPVRRNVVVTDSVIDGPGSIIFDEAENRLHVQKAVLSRLLGDSAGGAG
jgi:N-acetylornithine carbamoyltransferase